MPFPFIEEIRNLIASANTRNEGVYYPERGALSWMMGVTPCADLPHGVTEVDFEDYGNLVEITVVGVENPFYDQVFKVCGKSREEAYGKIWNYWQQSNGGKG